MNNLLNYIRRVIPIFFLYFDIGSDIYITILLYNNIKYFIISIFLIFIPYVIIWASKYNLDNFTNMILNYESRPYIIKQCNYLMYFYSIPIFGILFVIISDIIETLYIIYFYTKHYKKDYLELSKLEKENLCLDKFKYRTIIENIYETIPQIFFQYYIFCKSIDINITKLEIYLSITFAILNLLYNIITLYFNSRYYGSGFFNYLLFFMSGEQDRLIEYGFGLNNFELQKNIDYKAKNIIHHIKYTRYKLNYHSIKSIKNYIYKNNIYMNKIKQKNLESINVIFEISQDLKIKLPIKYSSNVFSSDILNLMMNIRDKRYKYNYNINLVMSIINNLNVQEDFFYLLTYNTNEYKNIHFEKIKKFSYDNYIKTFLTFYLLPNYYKNQLNLISEENYSNLNKNDYIHIYKKNFKIQNDKNNLQSLSPDYDITEFKKKYENEIVDKHNESLFLLSVVCYHCPISIFSKTIDILNHELKSYGISENNHNICNLDTEMNNKYHKKKILELINLKIINNLDRFDKYKYLEQENIYKNIGKNRKSILNLYDININGSFELGTFKIKNRKNSIVTKRRSIQENNKYNIYETINYNIL